LKIHLDYASGKHSSLFCLFVSDEEKPFLRLSPVRPPERKPNSYNCDKPIFQQEKYFGGTPHPSATDLAAQGREAECVPMRPTQPNAASRPPSGDPFMNGKGPPVDRQQQQQQQQQQGPTS